ncbi:Hypothetical_protein [Hexamita inflata]|uniref:Hypothetical_protein n=1 Tax=Hexamita inflata TaxID=28002 RepID=A0AA86V6L1_9EUKA|nr:Hypothetical protein HINF_LOCUS61877 [Hexamita inflata]CAI9978267.1 Hypothetical protein HINF_LOCUS65912 [Hexamita inflata]
MIPSILPSLSQPNLTNQNRESSSKMTFSVMSSRLKSTQSVSNLLENFEYTIKKYPVRKIQDGMEISESTSYIREYIQFPYEYTSDSDTDWDQIDVTSLAHKRRVLCKTIKLETKELMKTYKNLKVMETESLDVVRQWIKRIFELQKQQLDWLLRRTE